MARLLVVDDDRTQIELRRLVLETSGHEVFVAQTAPQALDVLAAEAPDILLMDLRLPDVNDGLALIRCAHTRAAHVRIIVLSGWPLDLFEQPEGRLVDRVLTKPIRTKDLLAAIRELF